MVKNSLFFIFYLTNKFEWSYFFRLCQSQNQTAPAPEQIFCQEILHEQHGDSDINNIDTVFDPFLTWNFEKTVESISISSGQLKT